MKTFSQWCEQTGKDDMADELNQVTQNALKSGKDPKQDVQKILAKKGAEAQITGNTKKVAKVAAAASEINADQIKKP